MLPSPGCFFVFFLRAWRSKNPQREDKKQKHSAADLNNCDTREETNHHKWLCNSPFNLTASHFPGLPGPRHAAVLNASGAKVKVFFLSSSLSEVRQSFGSSQTNPDNHCIPDVSKAHWEACRQARQLTPWPVCSEGGDRLGPQSRSKVSAVSEKLEGNKCNTHDDVLQGSEKSH